MLFHDITLLDENLQLRSHMSLQTRDEQIVWIKPAAAAAAEAQSANNSEVYNGTGKLLLPGFINCHSHLAMTLLRGYGENLPLSKWYSTRILPFESCLTGKDIYWGALLGLAESLRFGIVSSSDMYWSLPDMAEAIAASGAKCSLCRGSSSVGEQDGYYGSVQHVEHEAIWPEYHNCCHGRIQLDVGMHAEYTSNQRYVTELAEYAGRLNAHIQVHVSETRKEKQECQARHNGLTPVQYLNQCGLFEQPATAAHCVYLEDDDLAILRDKNIAVATCPKSNLKLASGICNLPQLQAQHINWVIGTDGCASNNNLNMLEEMKFLALLQKGANLDPTLITPQQVIYAATKGGALAQGRLDCGSLKAGNKADLIVFDTTAPYWQPQHNLLHNLLYSACGTDVVLTMVDGRVLYQDGLYKTIDIEQVLAETQASRRRILSELHI